MNDLLGGQRMRSSNNNWAMSLILKLILKLDLVIIKK